MKKYSSYVILFSSLFHVMASAAEASPIIQCTVQDSQGVYDKIQPLDVSKDLEMSFKDRQNSAINFKISFSKSLNTVDSTITDTDLKIEAMGTEWTNESPKGAHSAIRLSTPKGTFLLSCAAIGIP